jgi:RNA polymerase sigma factor (sigma-70 family)
MTTIEQPTVYLIDDEPAIRKALARLLRIAGWRVEAFGSCEEFLHGHDQQAPGCIVLDVMLPGLSGEELQRLLADSGNPLPIIFITGQGDIPMCARAIKAGAVEFLTKPVDADELFRAVNEAVERDRENRRSLADVAAIKQCLAMLTPREREVLVHVVAGKANKNIAAELGTVEKTVKVHRARVMEKMRAESLAELVRLAAQVGIGTFGPSGSGGA